MGQSQDNIRCLLLDSVPLLVIDMNPNIQRTVFYTVHPSIYMFRLLTTPQVS